MFSERDYAVRWSGRVRVACGTVGASGAPRT